MDLGDQIKNSRNLLVQIALVALLSSCISHNHSAGDWVLPSTLPDGSCPNISGKYTNSGLAADSSAPAYLYCELISRKSDSCSVTEAKLIDQITIDQKGTELNISALRGDDIISSVSLVSSQDDYLCKDGWIALESKGVRGYGSSAVEFASLTRNFAISQNHLLEKRRPKAFYLLVFFQ